MNKQRKVFVLCLLVALVSAIVFFSMLSERQEDVLRFLPDGTIAYLEAQDLRQLVSVINQDLGFQPENIPSGISLSLAITDFEFQKDDNSRNKVVVNLKPKFLGILKTGYRQTLNLSFVENQFDALIRSFDSEVSIGKKNDGRIVWSKDEEEKFFCLALDNLIFFSNDPALIDFASVKAKPKSSGNSSQETSSTNVKKKIGSGRSHKGLVTPEEIKKEKAEAKDALVFAYISRACISELADLIVVSLANFVSDDEKSREILLRILPGLINSSFESVSWRMEKEQSKIKDTLLLKTEKSLAEVFKITFQPHEGDASEFIEVIPAEASSFTVYSFQNPKLTWRSFVLSIAEKMRFLDYSVLTDLFFEGYGIQDAEGFFDSVGHQILVIRFGESETVVVGKVEDAEKLKKSVTSEINLAEEPIREMGAEIWKSDEWAVAIFNGKVFLGSPENVGKCLEARKGNLAFSSISEIPKKSPIFTFSKSKTSLWFSKTSFSDSGFRYELISESGLISSLIDAVK